MDLCVFVFQAIVVWRKRKKESSKLYTTNQLNQPSNCEIYQIYCHLWPIITTYVLGLFVCKTVSYLQGVAVSASINTMVAVTLDRFLAICFPLDWHMSRRGARWTIFFIWLFSSTIAMPWAMFFTLEPYQLDHWPEPILLCEERWPDQQMDTLYFICANLILCYLFPLLVITICYIGIWYKIWRRNIPGDRPKGLKIELIMQKSKLKVVKMMFVVVVIFVLSWAPLYAIFARVKLGPQIEQNSLEESILLTLTPLAQWLGASNSCINPILYTFFNRKYRKGFAEMLKMGKCWGSSRSVQTGTTTTLSKHLVAPATAANGNNNNKHCCCQQINNGTTDGQCHHHNQSDIKAIDANGCCMKTPAYKSNSKYQNNHSIVVGINGTIHHINGNYPHPHYHHHKNQHNLSDNFTILHGMNHQMIATKPTNGIQRPKQTARPLAGVGATSDIATTAITATINNNNNNNNNDNDNENSNSDAANHENSNNNDKNNIADNKTDSISGLKDTPPALEIKASNGSNNGEISGENELRDEKRKLEATTRRSLYWSQDEDEDCDLKSRQRRQEIHANHKHRHHQDDDDEIIGTDINKPNNESGIRIAEEPNMSSLRDQRPINGDIPLVDYRSSADYKRLRRNTFGATNQAPIALVARINDELLHHHQHHRTQNQQQSQPRRHSRTFGIDFRALVGGYRQKKGRCQSLVVASTPANELIANQCQLSYSYNQTPTAVLANRHFWPTGSSNVNFAAADINSNHHHHNHHHQYGGADNSCGGSGASGRISSATTTQSTPLTTTSVVSLTATPNNNLGYMGLDSSREDTDDNTTTTTSHEDDTNSREENDDSGELADRGYGADCSVVGLAPNDQDHHDQLQLQLQQRHQSAKIADNMINSENSENLSDGMDYIIINYDVTNKIDNSNIAKTFNINNNNNNNNNNNDTEDSFSSSTEQLTVKSANSTRLLSWDLVSNGTDDETAHGKLNNRIITNNSSHSNINHPSQCINRFSLTPHHHQVSVSLAEDVENSSSSSQNLIRSAHTHFSITHSDSNIKSATSITIAPFIPTTTSITTNHNQSHYISQQEQDHPHQNQPPHSLTKQQRQQPGSSYNINLSSYRHQVDSDVNVSDDGDNDSLFSYEQQDPTRDILEHTYANLNKINNNNGKINCNHRQQHYHRNSKDHHHHHYDREKEEDNCSHLATIDTNNSIKGKNTSETIAINDSSQENGTHANNNDQKEVGRATKCNSIQFMSNSSSSSSYCSNPDLASPSLVASQNQSIIAYHEQILSNTQLQPLSSSLISRHN